nr:MAG TPA: Thymidylate synthase complementing protein [Crassvirales sp.]
MKIIKPKVELWLQEDAKAHVARCARVCYGRETGNDEATIRRLINDKHWSMFRHESVYAIIPEKSLWHDVMVGYKECPYIDWIKFRDNYYVATNGNFLLDVKEKSPVLYQWLTQYRVDALTFNNIHPLVSNLMRYTFKITTQISTSRELNRVSPNNIAERSTRYVYEDGSICRPHWLKDYSVAETLYGKYIIYKDGIEQNDINAHKVRKYIESCDRGFNDYQYLVKAGLHRQDARGVLPLDTATECVYTYSYKEWCHILDLRYYGTTGVPHENTRIIAGMIRNELMELGYEFREG